MSESKQSYESLVLRVLWMAIFVIVWRVAELVLLALVVVQLVYRLFKGRPHVEVMNFGDSLSQYLAQIGRYGSFHSDEKPWPFADWPIPREPQGEGAAAVCAAQAAAVSPEPAAARDESAVEEVSTRPAAEDEAAAATEPQAEGEPQVEAVTEKKPETDPDAPTEPKA